MGLLDRVGRFIDDVLLLPEDVRGEVERAEQALSEGVHDRAEEGFLAALAVRPSLARAWVGLARSRDGLGDRAGAREALEEARSLVPEDGALALWAARAALEAGDREAALEHGRAAAGRLPSSDAEGLSEAWRIVGRAEREAGRPDRALRDLRKALARAPDDVEVRAELAEAAADLDRPREAVASVRGLEPAAVEPELALRLGTALQRTGQEGARAWLARAADAGVAPAMERLARLDAAGGTLDEAERWARRAVAVGGGASALAALAEVLVARGRAAEAAETFAAASERAGGDPELLRTAARIAPVDDPATLIRYADALEARAKGDPAARAARAWASLARGELDAAAELTAGGNEARGWLARAGWALRAGRANEALEALGRFDARGACHPWVASDRDRAEALRREALRAAWRTPDGGVDLAGAMEAVARFARDRALPSLERAASALRDELDRPLRLAILGEFNAGKSTLVNAFLGAEVAPMGVLPTTATVHVLRAGPERRVRVTERGGRTREGAWSELGELLSEVGAANAEQVEIVVPSARLERVWLVDTPGTNATEAGHAERAVEAARRADVVLWVFDAAQAGKASEGEVLAAVQQACAVVLPVVNKRDRVAAEQLDAVRGHVAAALDVQEVPTLSARRALEARRADDPGGVERSGFGELERWLDRVVFERAGDIKRRVGAARLARELERAIEGEAERLDEERRRLAEQAGHETGLRGLGDALAEQVPAACRELARAQERVVAEAAGELAVLARPSRGRADGAEAREDRAFVAGDLGRRLLGAIEAAERDLLHRMDGRLGEWDGAVGAAIRAAVGGAFARHAGYQQGLLEGGRVDRAFDALRPGDEGDPDRAAAALTPAVADPWEHLAPALREAIVAAVARAVASHRQAREEARRRVERRQTEVDEPLRALRDVLETAHGPSGAEACISDARP